MGISSQVFEDTKTSASGAIIVITDLNAIKVHQHRLHDRNGKLADRSAFHHTIFVRACKPRERCPA